jgi:hypothetical protein
MKPIHEALFELIIYRRFSTANPYCHDLPGHNQTLLLTDTVGCWIHCIN